ncbi:molybdopterin-dependent oxidoreductase [Stygiobacter electus]|uniref:Molybdopterin-dependent oxidoreductase n=1 Tax=Stygiobacter electus TaxID=3032292 RepID=A0AAE3NYQ0_9BACT|nr:molybdopterin-dependent oxidoreductase [Stygiobacter electus]MDF1611089.1 molybdopterin-dependent oxidoreductase [Stygiobacter electus]
MPTITIDGKQVEFKPGQTVIQAAMDAGIDIPHFCYHPKLSISGNCRVCLVEIEKMPKLAISCATLASDGMVVHTKSDKTLDARNAVMEFILINHPLDCPICDEAGECKLQEYAFAHSRGESRFDEIKNRKEKRVQLGPRVKFDAERCISCSRCIRFSDEIAKSNQLTFKNRGDKVTITTFPGESFDNPYTLNTVDICPVGALTNNDFRFKSRVWEMSSTNSVCIGCSRGCNIEIWVRNNEILRLTPRYNEEVNSFWMCDNGRLNTFKFVNSETRIDSCYLRKEGELVKSNWVEALEVTAKSLKEFKSNEVAFIASPYSTLEDNFILQKFAKQINSNNIFYANHIIEGDQDEILIREDKTPNSLGLKLLGIKNDISKLIDLIQKKNVKALLIMEEDLAGLGSEWENLLSKLELTIVIATNQNKTTLLADIILPAATYAEKHGTFVNFQGRVQRIRPAVETEELDRSLDGMSKSRWDKFGTKFDRWMQGKKYDAKPSWKIFTLLDSYFSNKIKFKMAEEVFDEISKSNDVFKDLDYDVIGDLGSLIKKEVYQNV